MDIQPPCVVRLTWKLSDTLGRAIDELSAPAEFFVGGTDLLAKVEEVLRGQARGFEAEIQLEPEHAFGDYHAGLVCFEDRSLFPDALEVGMAYEGLPPGSRTAGMPSDAIYIVTEVYPSHVVLDGNHPLAGLALRLKLEVRGVREATPEEVDAGTIGVPQLTVLGTGHGGLTTPGGLH